MAAFNTFLRTDPQFYYDSPEALLEGYQLCRSDWIPAWSSCLASYPVRPMACAPFRRRAPDTTTAYYVRPAIDGSRPGWYYVNLHRPEVRPKFEMEVLSVHERPGAPPADLAGSGLTGLPEFRRNGGFTAFIESWGLYSNDLATIWVSTPTLLRRPADL